MNSCAGAFPIKVKEAQQETKRSARVTPAK